MRKIFTALMIMASIIGYAATDTTVIPKKDTVFIVLVDVIDTVSVNVMYKKSSKSERIYVVEGFALIRGFKVKAGNEFKWVQKPVIIGYLDRNKKPFKKSIQIL